MVKALKHVYKPAAWGQPKGKSCFNRKFSLNIGKYDYMFYNHSTSLQGTKLFVHLILAPNIEITVFSVFSSPGALRIPFLPCN